MESYARFSRQIYEKAVADSGCKQFIAETKILFPSIEKILMRAIEIITDKLPALDGNDDSLVATLLMRTREIYSEKYSQWHSQKIIIADVFIAVAAGVEQITALALMYQIKLKSGREWSFEEDGPLLSVYDDIVAIVPPDTENIAPEPSPFLRSFLFTQSDQRMLRSRSLYAGEGSVL